MSSLSAPPHRHPERLPFPTLETAARAKPPVNASDYLTSLSKVSSIYHLESVLPLEDVSSYNSRVKTCLVLKLKVFCILQLLPCSSDKRMSSDEAPLLCP